MDSNSDNTSVRQAITTEYAGHNMRSRLEAKWAMWFDLLGIAWEYEPIDYGGWVPDFGISGTNGQILVEVKPVIGMEWTQKSIEKIQYAVSQEREQIPPILVVCARNPLEFSSHGNRKARRYQWVCGWVGQRTDPDHPLEWVNATVGIDSWLAKPDAAWNVAPQQTAPGRVLPGLLAQRPVDWRERPLRLSFDAQRALKAAWAKASNSAQFKPVTPTERVDIEHSVEATEATSS